MRLPIAFALLAAVACRPDVESAANLFADPVRVDLAAARIDGETVSSALVVANVGTSCVGVEAFAIDDAPSGIVELTGPELPTVLMPSGVLSLRIRPLILPVPEGTPDAVVRVDALLGSIVEGACVIPDEAPVPLQILVPLVLATPAICDDDGDGALIAPCGGDDCDDTDATVFPGAEEICNERDDDCDSVVDGPEAIDAVDWFADTDADGFGDAGNVTRACEAPEGHTADHTDCDDTDEAIFPGAAEICDGLDQDCDLDIDEGFARFDFHPDADGDGYGDPGQTIRACVQPPDAVPNGTDCDDTRADVFPGAPEACDGVDQDCDGVPDDNPAVAPAWWLDTDGDSFGNPAIFVVECVKPAGYAGNNRDCNDNDASIRPNALEICDGVDQNCNNVIDDDPIDGDPWYPDTDGDGFGDEGAVEIACEQPDGYIADGGDCDDGDDDINPDANEQCDAVDQDCDGLIDQGQNVCACPVRHFGDHAYAFCNATLTWQFSNFACSLTGYDLVKIDDAAEDTFVATTARSYNAGGWWTGYSDGDTEGRWVWTDGTVGTYTNWAPGRPQTGANNADCMQIGSPAGWTDVSCGAFTFARFVCEAGP